jgi:hypothetical protein
MKRPFAVWESEYPDEGSNLLFATSERGASRKYRRMTRERAAGFAELVHLSASPFTTEQALALARSAQ